MQEFKIEKNEGISEKMKTILTSISIDAVLIVVGLIVGDPAIFGNILVICIFIAVVPLFLKQYTEILWIKSLEDQFPNFVRDLADSRRSGMSFSESIKIVAKGNYGKLTDEIKSMNNRLSWGVPFLRVLDIFENKAKKSKLIKESVNIIKESYKTGGNIVATLDAVARDMIMLKEAEAERRSVVREQVLIMYGIFFMFLGISIAIIFVMVPMINSQAGANTASMNGFGLQFSNPCEEALFPFNIFPCAYYDFIGTLFGSFTGATLYYLSMFFTVVIIQGVFTGLIAGQIGEDSTTAGVKHSLIMAVSAFAIFMLIAKLGLFPA